MKPSYNNQDYQSPPDRHNRSFQSDRSRYSNRSGDSDLQRNQKRTQNYTNQDDYGRKDKRQRFEGPGGPEAFRDRLGNYGDSGHGGYSSAPRDEHSHGGRSGGHGHRDGHRDGQRDGRDGRHGHDSYAGSLGSNSSANPSGSAARDKQGRPQNSGFGSLPSFNGMGKDDRRSGSRDDRHSRQDRDRRSDRETIAILGKIG